MPKKRSSRVATKRKTKKKSWWSFFFVLAIATVIGLPISYNMTKSSSQVASTGTSKIAEVVPIYEKVKSVNFATGCTDPVDNSQGFKNVLVSCTDGRTDALNTTACAHVVNVLSNAAKFCTANISYPTSTSTPSGIIYPTRNPTPTPGINYPVTPTTSGVACSGKSPSGKILICFISTCASKNLKTYTPANSYCKGLGKTNCCEW